MTNESSNMRTIHPVTRINPYALCTVADVGDIVEVSPPFDPSGNTALVGATIMYELLCLLAESPSSSSP